MLQNYLLTTLRSIARRKGFSILNVVGLAIGLSASLLILQYVKDELSFDNFHANAARTYRVQFDAWRNGQRIFECATAFPKVAPMMKADFPEVEEATRLYLRYGGGVVRYNDVALKENNLFQAEQSFFQVFSYPLLAGESKLDQPNTAVIEEKTARKYFGSDDPIGKRIRFGDQEEYEITGVIQLPENSHLVFSFLLSYPTLVTLWGEGFNNAWGWYDFYTYVVLRPGSEPRDLEAKFPAFIDTYGNDNNSSNVKASERTQFKLQPLEDIHLYSNLIQEARVNGNGRTVYFLMIIAFFILIIAWVNYINLSTARAVERAREVGIRKAVGAHKTQLVFQFVAESFMVNLSAAVLGLILVYMAIPAFNQMTGKELTYSIFFDPLLWLALVGLFLLGSLLSGLYPAFILSSYKPALVLKGAMKNSRQGLLLRKGLVVGQFVASVALIAGTIIVYNQLRYMENQKLGINIDQTLVINAPGVVEFDSLYGNYLEVYRHELSNHPDVKSFTAVSEVPGNLIFWTSGAKRIGDDESLRNQMYIMGVDFDFFKTFGNEVLAGRSFAREFTGDSASVVLNRKAVEMFNLKNPENAINQQIAIGRDTFRVVGVIENYHQEGLKVDFRPTAFRLQQNARSYFCVKMDTRHMEQTLAYLKEKYLQVFPNNPFDYFFLDSFFNRQYQGERQFGSVFAFFSMLAIFVASLGLFGLASFTATQRTKEIGIRKVLGSSVARIFVLLSKDFLRLVVIANVIAIPLVWIVMDRWLNSFAFHITIGVWVFVVAAIATTLVALITVSYQSLKAAFTNPVTSLRYE